MLNNIHYPSRKIILFFDAFEISCHGPTPKSGPGHSDHLILFCSKNVDIVNDLATNIE